MTDLAENGLDGQRQIAASVSEPYLRALRKHLFSSGPQKKNKADLPFRSTALLQAGEKQEGKKKQQAPFQEHCRLLLNCSI